MILGRLTPAQDIEIWQPRYHDNVILIAKHKVGTHNRITFTKAKHLAGQEFYLSGENIRQWPLESNGRIMCYVVPLDELEPLERSDD